ncbi:MAG TPA: PAS domain S-box protein [Desulfobulbus sp.]|nr:PAS domain S-box protein [Desulfobulbus sp.]
MRRIIDPDRLSTLCQLLGSETMEHRFADAYRRELERLLRRRVSYILVVGMVFVLLFSFLDSYMAPVLSSEFLRYRLETFALGGLLLLANHLDRKGRFTHVICCAGYLLITLFIVLLVVRTGGVRSPYWVGLPVIIITYTAIAPLTPHQTMICGTMAAVFYVLGLFFFAPVPTDSLLILFNNLFFILCFIMIAAIQSCTENSAREREFILRMEEDAAAGELARQADLLEEEVTRRTSEQRASEERYRLLLEQIADDILLVDGKGDILHASPRFYRHMGAEAESGGRRSLLGFVAEQDRQRVRDDLLARLGRGESVAGFQLRLAAADGRQVDAEISGTLLTRNRQVLGLQLVIRDVSRRKLLEQELLRSLQMVKMTETATILALARLSEHRDITPGRHLERIREYCTVLARELARGRHFGEQVSDTYIYNLRQAVVLHDIGKVSIPDAILMKRGQLTAEEEEICRRHTINGGDVIKAMQAQGEGSGFLAMAKSIAYFHHERWDGTGYPQGLKGKEIPLSSRIMAVADSYESMTSCTLYREVYSHRQAVEAIVLGAGYQYDPVVVEAFVARQRDFDRIRREYSEEEGDLGRRAV